MVTPRIRYTRREFNRSLAALPASLLLPKIDSTYQGVRLGTISYSFRNMPYIVAKNLYDYVLDDCRTAGVGFVELMCNHVEPVTEFTAQSIANGSPNNGIRRGAYPRTPEGTKARDDLRQWRLKTPMSYFTNIRKKFEDAGVSIYAYTVPGIGGDDFTSDEIDRMFDQARALGATTISGSTTLSAAQRLVPFVEKRQFPVAFHNHADLVDPNQFCTPESMRKAIAMSKYFRINLDIGHYVQANLDPLPLIEEIHDRITHLHVADGRRNNQPEVPFGTGDTPLKQVMALLKTKRYPIVAIVELEYAVPPGSTAPAEVKKCLDYLRQALA